MFLAAMLVLIVLTSLYLVHYNRRMFQQVAALSGAAQRTGAAADLHAGEHLPLHLARAARRFRPDPDRHRRHAAAHRAARRPRPTRCAPICARCRRSCSPRSKRSARFRTRCIPVVLDEAGFEGALDAYLPGFEKQTGIAVHYEKTGAEPRAGPRRGHPLYRVMQEALNNVARHSQVDARRRCACAICRTRWCWKWRMTASASAAARGQGMGLVSMRERAELVNGRVEFLERAGGGALVRLTVPAGSGGGAMPEAAHFRAAGGRPQPGAARLPPHAGGRPGDPRGGRGRATATRPCEAAAELQPARGGDGFRAAQHERRRGHAPDPANPRPRPPS